MTVLATQQNRNLIITRLTIVSGFKSDYATVTGTKAEVQPASPTKTELFDGVMGKTFVIFVDGTIDIAESDKLRDTSSGKFYKVMNGGISRRTHSNIDYLEVTVQEVN